MHMTGLAKIAAAMANRGSFDGVRILGEKGWNFFSKEILSFNFFWQKSFVVTFVGNNTCTFAFDKYAFFAKIYCSFLWKSFLSSSYVYFFLAKMIHQRCNWRLGRPPCQPNRWQPGQGHLGTSHLHHTGTYRAISMVSWAFELVRFLDLVALA